MAHISQRRDLTEPNVAEDFAAQIGSLDSLNMPAVLSYSDMKGGRSRGVEQWKGNLLWISMSALA